MRNIERSGKRALVHYRGGAAGEEIIEDYSTGEPVEIMIGCGQVPKGIDDMLFEMEIGEQRTVIVPCEKAYGHHDPEGVQTYLRDFITNGDKLELGTVFAWTNPATNMPIPVKVIDATEETVTIDFNHPLAGKNLEYWLELVDVI